MTRRAVAALGVALAMSMSSPAAAATFDTFVPYRAVYDLAVDPAGIPSGLAAVAGRMVTEFSGSACAGYTTLGRFVTDATTSDGKRQVIDSRVRSVETADERFTFLNETYTDRRLSEASAGAARRHADGRVRVALTSPAQKTLDLDAKTLYPTELLAGIVAAARKGARLASFDLYDGSGNGETLLAASVVIGRQATDDAVGADTPVREAGFAATPHWPITVSYFRKTEGSDETPVYAMEGVLYENGIAAQVKFIYDKLVMTGRMTTLTMLPPVPCP